MLTPSDDLLARPADPGDAARLTIEELAERSGVSVRNLRSYQTRGLIAAPRLEKHGGPYVAYYGRDHLDRLAIIDRLRARGFSLEAIRELLDAWSEGHTVDEILGLEAAITTVPREEPPLRLTRAERDARFPELAGDDELAARAAAAGVIVAVDGGFEVPSPTLLHLATELTAAGIPLTAILDGFAVLRAGAASTATELTATMREQLLGPILEAGLSAERLASASETLRRLPAIASEAMRIVFLDALRDAMDLSKR